MNSALGLFGYLAIAVVGATVIAVFIGLPCFVFVGWAVNKACDFIDGCL